MILDPYVEKTGTALFHIVNHVGYSYLNAISMFILADAQGLAKSWLATQIKKTAYLYFIYLTWS